MPQYLSPGVYVEDVAPLARPIAGVGTSTAAFIGVSDDIPSSRMPEKAPGFLPPFSTGTIAYAPGTNTVTLTGGTWPDIPAGGLLIVNGQSYDVDTKLSSTTLSLGKARPSGAINAGTAFTLLVAVRYTQAPALRPVLVTSWQDFRQSFGDFLPANQALAHAVYAFFNNGGSRCYVARVGRGSFNDGTVTYKQADKTLTISTGKTWPSNVAGSSVVINGTAYPVKSRQSDTVLVLDDTNNPGADIAAGASYVLKLASGYDTAGFTSALAAIEAIDEIALVCAPLPDDVSASDRNAAHVAMLGHCANLGSRFAILDSTRQIASDNLAATSDATGVWVPTNKDGYGAFYFPWVTVSDPTSSSGGTVDVPPCGHVAGVMARVDAGRGVYKAPANEELLGVLRPVYAVTRNQQDGLNNKGVNCLRDFYGTPLIWGARTVADPSSEFRYVNVRRSMIFLRESIEQGVRWAVFEPNAPALWQRITRSVSDFLLGQWRDGALFGDTPQQAFFVQCDKNTNPSDVREQGQVVTLVGVAVVKPAEFVIFRIQQQTGGWPARAGAGSRRPTEDEER